MQGRGPWSSVKQCQGAAGQGLPRMPRGTGQETCISMPYCWFQYCTLIQCPKLSEVGHPVWTKLEQQPRQSDGATLFPAKGRGVFRQKDGTYQRVAFNIGNGSRGQGAGRGGITLVSASSSEDLSSGSRPRSYSNCAAGRQDGWWYQASSN